MSENNLVLRAELLRLASTGSTGLLLLARKLRIGPAKLITLLDGMREEGLVDIDEAHSNRAGRPMRRVKATELGMEFLKAFDELMLKTLKSRRAELQRASADAEYAKRLASRGVLPYDLFLELNEIAHRAGRSPV